MIWKRVGVLQGAGVNRAAHCLSLIFTLVYFSLLFCFIEAISRKDLPKFVLVLRKDNSESLSLSSILISHSNSI